MSLIHATCHLVTRETSMCNLTHDGIWFGVRDLSQQVKALGNVLMDLSSIPSTPMKVEGER